MSIRGPMKPGEIRECTKNEDHFNMVLMIARNELIRRAESVKDRLAASKWGWRNLNLMLYCVNYVQDAINQTLPDKNKIKYKRYNDFGQLRIEVPSAVEPDTFLPVEKDDLNILVASAVYGECTTCTLEGKEIKHCPLRQVLMRLAPPEELTDHTHVMSCEYIKLGQMLVDGPKD